jgi:hypothetical protein
VESYGEAVVGESPGDRGTDSASRPGDDGDLARGFAHVFLLCLGSEWAQAY